MQTAQNQLLQMPAVVYFQPPPTQTNMFCVPPNMWEILEVN